MNKECWKAVKRNECYAVSSFGRVATLDHFINHPINGLKKVNGRERKLIKENNGYLSIELGKRNSYLVHRLVAVAFIENPLKKPCVNHLDGNKSNNRVENLQWCTYSENEKYSYSHLGKKPNKTFKNKKNNPNVSK